MADIFELYPELKDAWLNIDVDRKKIYNPLMDIPREYMEPDMMPLYITWLFTRVEYISFFCKEVMNVQLLPTQALFIKEMWDRKFPMLIGTRGFGKSFLLALYALLRAILLPGRQIAICGAAFRQSKILFGYMNKIFDNAPVLRDIIYSSGSGMGPFKSTDLVGFKIGESRINCFPLGDGQKIRGQRANDVIADEFATINRDIFETVIAGFAIVSADPLGNVQMKATLDYAKKHNIQIPEEFHKRDAFNLSNQIVISGTAYYSINHFAEYWKMWKAWVLSRGDMSIYYKLIGKDLETVDEDELSKERDRDWRDYCIFRIPYEKIPKGFMDEGQRNRARASITKGAYEMEYGAVFSKDSDGFFKFTSIEAATTHPDKRFYGYRPDGGFTHFVSTRNGRPGSRYVMGVDPASEVDRFSIIIIEMCGDHNRIVYAWSTNKAEHRARIKAGQVDEYNYFAFCAFKIRELTRAFNIERIAIDSQGGGYQIEEALHDYDKLDHELGDKPFWRIIDDNKKQDTDILEGPKILDMVNFANYEWLSTANHGLKKDITDKTLLFPYYDSAALVTDESNTMDPDVACFDTLEDVFEEIEELKNELISIVITITPSGRERWDTPEIKMAHGTKGRARKDRYSALLLANKAARDLMPHAFSQLDRSTTGGFARMPQNENELENAGYNISPEWVKKNDNNAYDLYGAV